MKHATSETLESIDALLRRLRARHRLIERTPGCFYFKSKAFLHFHHDPSGIYADVKRDTAGFSRMRCTSPDMIVRKNSEYRITEFERRQRVQVGGVLTWIVSREDLILSKLVWSRDTRSELQRRDVKALLGQSVDVQYVSDWANRLDVGDLWNEIRNE